MMNMSKVRKILMTLFTALLSVAAATLMFGFMPASKAEASEIEPDFDVATCAVEHNHDYSITLRTVEPTCTEDGYDMVRCSVCGETTNYYHTGDDDYADYKALGHLWDEDENIIVVSPTCTESGVTYHYCPRCGETYTEEPTNATGHDFDDVIYEPDCVTSGYTQHYCRKCGYSYTDGETEPLGHSYIRTITPATCLSGGWTYFECSVCGYDYTGDRTDPLGHDYVDEVAEPGCEAYGYTRHTCSRCKDSFVDSVTAPYGHLFDGMSQVLATGSSYGYVKLSCSVCGCVYITNIVSPGEEDEEHDFVLTIVRADCYGGGYWIYECADCGTCVVCNETDPLEHEWTSEYVAPTCTEEGGWYLVCVNCDDAYLETREEPLGHDLFVSACEEATCTEDGYTVYGCVNCEYTYMTLAPATGHVYEVGEVRVSTNGSLSLTYTCKGCSSSAVSRLYVTFVDDYGHAYTYLFDSDGVADFSGLPSGKYTAYIKDEVTGDTVTMFAFGDGVSSSDDPSSDDGDESFGAATGDQAGDTPAGETSDTGSGDGGAGSGTGEGGDTPTAEDGGEREDAHEHAYSVTVSNDSSTKTVTLSYKCSVCGDDGTCELYVVFTSGTFSMTCYVDSTGTLTYDFLDEGVYTGAVYNGSGSKVGQFTATVLAGETSPDTEEHVHAYDLVITPDLDSYIVVVSYKCSCGDDLTGELEVAILDADGDAVCVYWPDEDGIVDFKGDLDESGTYSVVVSSMDEEVLGFVEIAVDLSYEAEDGGGAYAPSTSASSSEKGGGGNGAIIALLVVFLVVVAGGVTAWIIYKRRKKKKAAETAENEDAAENLDDEDVTPSGKNNSSSGNGYFDDDDDD